MLVAVVPETGAPGAVTLKRVVPLLTPVQYFHQSTAVNEAGWDNMGTAALTVQQCLATTGWGDHVKQWILHAPWTVWIVLCCMPCPALHVLPTSPLNRRWDFIMYRAMDTASPFAVFYFLLVLIIGTYLLVSGGNVLLGCVALKLVWPAELQRPRIHGPPPYSPIHRLGCMYLISNETSPPLQDLQLTLNPCHTTNPHR